MMEYRILRNYEVEKWFDFTSSVYGEDDEQKTAAIRDDAVFSWKYEINKEQTVVFIAEENSRIISSVHLSFREAYYLGTIIKVGVIGGVATLTEYRKQGIASKLLDMAIETMKKRGYHVSMLGALAHVRGVYRNKGWQCSVKNNKKITFKSKNSTDYLLRKFNINHDINEVANIYEAFSKRYNGPFVRNNNYILWQKLKEKYQVWVVENELGNIIAYFASDEMEPNSFVITEYGCLSGYDNLFDSFVECFCYTLGNEMYDVEFSGSMPTKYEINWQDQYWGYMYCLIKQFRAENIEINTTEDFIYHLHGNGETNIDNIQDSNALFWYTDNF